TALPVWAVYKSNICTGFAFGLDPRDHETEWEFRKAVAERRAPESPSHGVTQRPSDQVTQEAAPVRPQRTTAPVVESFVSRTTIAPPLQLLLTRLVLEADHIRKGKEDEAAAILREALERISVLLDKRRIKDD